jgi:arginyl-tRNA synthetase
MNSYGTIREALISFCAQHGIAPSFSLDQPEMASHGDYATNVAFTLSKKLGKSPKETAESLVSELQTELEEIVEKAEVAGPGFINFFLKDDVRTDEVETIAASDLANEKGKGKVLVEYTDPNCFKVFHIGHVMANAIGEAIARLHEAAGYDVMRVCYPSDIGLNVAKGVWGALELASEKPANGASLKEHVAFLGKAYAFAHQKYEEDEAAKAAIVEVNKAIYGGTDARVMEAYAEGRTLSLEYFETLYEKLGTKFDEYIYESEVADPGLAIVKANIGKVFEESEGAVVYKGEADGLHTRVFINSIGLPTYETKDIGNYERKLALLPDAEKYVVITASEQSDYFKVVNRVTEKIHPELIGKLLHISHGMMRLASGKMSSRTGNVIGGEDLLDQIKEALAPRVADMRVEEENKEGLLNDIAVGAVKFSILKQAPGKDSIFDFEKSISFEGDSGPYLQYTHARICALLDKAREAGIDTESYMIGQPERELEQVLIGYEQALLKATSELAPQAVLQHLLLVTRAFNNLYGRVQIVGENKETSAYYVLLAQAARNVIAHGLSTLGIVAPERM